jgi:hypothetical protein
MFPPKTIDELRHLLFLSFNNPESLKSIRNARKNRRAQAKEKSFKRVVTYEVDSVADIHTWLAGVMDKQYKDEVTLRNKHGFYITKDEKTHQVLLRHKESAGDIDWLVSKVLFSFLLV